MSFWANELAPNLFDSYDAWYRNYIKVCDCFPGTDELKVAEDYFNSINKFIDVTDKVNKTCEHCYYWDPFEKDFSGGIIECRCACIQHYRSFTTYFSKCDHFKWREDIWEDNKNG